MVHPSIAVCQITNDADRAAFFVLASETFVKNGDPNSIARDLQRFVLNAPKSDPIHARGAYLDGTYAGGYLITERSLRIGDARIRTGCAGAVVTHPAHRRQGVATALMHDAFAFAKERGHALLVLHGLADFYTPFGFVDVFDSSTFAVRVEDALNLPLNGCRLVPASGDHADAMLALYDRHLGNHPGACDRRRDRFESEMRFAAAIATERYLQRDGVPFHAPVVVLDERGAVRGYMIGPWGHLAAFGHEVVAGDWAALSTLLRWHGERLAALPTSPEFLHWPLPSDSVMAQLLGDNLEIEESSLHRPRANWEAALVDGDRLLAAVVPTWSKRWRFRDVEQCPPLTFGIQGVESRVVVGLEDIRLEARPTPDERTMTLSWDAFAPLLFGFRSVASIAARGVERLDATLIPTMEVLFPSLSPWIAPSDGC